MHKRAVCVLFSVLVGAARLPLLLVLAGCSGAPSGAPASASARPAKSAQPAPSAEQPRRLAPLRERETWDIATIRGSRVGYAQTSVRHETRSGRKLVRIDNSTRLAMNRFGGQTEAGVSFTSIETPEGQLVECECTLQQGAAPMRTVARVVGNTLEMETFVQSKSIRSALPWSAQYGGFFATEETLLQEPMRPGERREFQALMPGLNQLVRIEMLARDYESVKLWTGTYQLLRIDVTTRFPTGQTLRGTAWSDRTGDTLKQWTDVAGIETYRVPKAVALEKTPERTEPAAFDLGRDLSVKLKSALPRPHETKRVRYRIHLEAGDPAGVFASGPTQRIKSLDPHTAELTVYAIRPGQDDGNPNAPADPPADGDRQPNTMIQSDDAKIAALARQAAGEEQDPWKVAVKLERFVHEFIQKKDFSTAFATAAEVAAHPIGDCTEHAVLLAALARARGIPARVAIGLVYTELAASAGKPPVPSLAYHMWTEVYVAGRWVPIDATLGRGGIGAAHLKLAHSNLKGASPYSAFLPVIQVIGRVEVEVAQSE